MGNYTMLLLHCISIPFLSHSFILMYFFYYSMSFTEDPIIFSETRILNNLNSFSVTLRLYMLHIILNDHHNYY